MSADSWLPIHLGYSSARWMDAVGLQEELAGDELGYSLIGAGPFHWGSSDRSVHFFVLGLIRFFREDLCNRLPGRSRSVSLHCEGLVKRPRVSNCGMKLALYPFTTVPDAVQGFYSAENKICLLLWAGEGQSLGCREHGRYV